MKKCVYLVSLVCLLSCRAQALSAQSAVVIDADTQAVLLEANADEVLPMASTTKIMTALVAIEYGDLDRVYTVTPEYAAVEGSSMYLQVGEQITVRDTLYGLMLSSGNDAAVALAGECGGEKAFLQAMNDKAAALGLTHTHFDNPNGLDSESHYTTARELAILSAFAMQNELFRQIVATKNYTASTHYCSNHNRLLSQYEGAVGIKTGYTKRCGRCLVSAAQRNGRMLIAVTLNDPNDWADHTAMLNDGFAQYHETILHRAGDTICTVPVMSGTTSHISLIAQQTVKAWLTPDEQDTIKRVRYGEKIQYAPLLATAYAGHLEYRIGAYVTAEDNLLYGETVMQTSETQSWLDMVRSRILGQ